MPANSLLSAPHTLLCWARERREDDGKYRGWGAETAPVDGLTPVTLWLQHVSGWQNRFRRSLWFIPCRLGPVAKSTAVLRRRVCNALFIPSLAGKKAHLFLSLYFTFFFFFPDNSDDILREVILLLMICSHLTFVQLAVVLIAYSSHRPQTFNNHNHR